MCGLRRGYGFGPVLGSLSDKLLAHTCMTLRRAACLLALTVVSAPAWATPTDSTDALSWARQMVQARRAVAAAEAEASPVAQASLAATAFALAKALAAEGPASERAARDLVLRAQAVYEPHHGSVAAMPLAHREVVALRGEQLAQLGPDFAMPLVDPAVEAARRAEAERVARALAAQAERAAGPDHLYYPAEAAHLVDGQRQVAARFSRTVRRGRSRLRAIERVMRRRSLPADLRFVAVIESALNPTAESWAGARGLWQFMPETAAEFGLDSLTVVDPAASTEAAARYLRQLRRMFRGDLQLALAAYNCGPGRVQRLVRAHRKEHGTYPTFWDLHDALPRETQAYVPRFIAVAELLR